MKTKIIAVAGPTASGKTDLAARLALKLGGEVISNDSMQVYRDMEIGTAAPSADEMLGVPHHMIGCVEPDEEFSCADYASAARDIIGDVSARGKIPVFCGGTGLYLDAVLSVENFSDSTKNEALREELLNFAEANGVEALHDRLKKIDPESAAAIHANNVRRVIRAIEIFETTGVTKTKWDSVSKHGDSPYDSVIVVPEFLRRETLYSRIEKRVDLMIDAGLECEVRSLWNAGLLNEKKPAYQAIGYKEFIPYFKGETTFENAVAEIKQNTRRYAKRQITWFKRYKDAVRIHPDKDDGTMRDSDEICTEVWERLKERQFIL